MKRLIVGASGASGSPLLIQCLELIREEGAYEIHLIVSEGAKLALSQETGLRVADLEPLSDVMYAPGELGAALASGSFQAEGMLVVPCSMKTAAGICMGYSDNLLLRAADVTMKEQRPLVLAARETPLSAVHLRNLYQLSQIQGVHIIPPMLAYYHHPETVGDMTYQAAARLLEPFGIEAPGFARWKGM